MIKVERELDSGPEIADDLHFHTRKQGNLSFSFQWFGFWTYGRDLGFRAGVLRFWAMDLGLRAEFCSFG